MARGKTTYDPNGSAIAWSRRRLLTTAGLAAGSGLAGTRGFAAAEQDSARKKFGGYPMGIHGASLAAFPIKEVARMVATDLGLHRMELTGAQIRMQDAKGGRFPGPAATPEEISQLRKLLGSFDITPTAFGPIRLTRNDPSNRDVFRRAKALGLRNLSCIPQLDALDSLEALADEFGVRLAIHNNAPGAPFSKISDVLKAVDGRGPNVGACLDIGNAIRASEDPAGALRRLGPRLLGIHLKDVSGRDPDSEVIVLGKGFLDVPEFFATLAEVGFPEDGALSLEYLEKPNDPLPGIREGLRIAAAAANG